MRTLTTMPLAHIGPHAASIEVVLDDPTLATIANLQSFYTGRLKAKTASKSAIIRRAVEALSEAVGRLERLPEGDQKLVGEAFRFAANRRAKIMTPPGVRR